MCNRFLFSFSMIMACLWTHAQVNISIDVTKELKPISPYIYGRNNSLPDGSFSSDLSQNDWVRLRESGVRMLREGGGNNSTKYNWRKHLSSHPDWYNNVYTHNWDLSVKYMLDSLPAEIQGMWTLQLIGKVAKTGTQNFNDWSFNFSQWWEGVQQNLAGGGIVNPQGGTAAKIEGNPDLYLESWPADSTVGIFGHWFDHMEIPKQRVQYWNMDNEPEIWHGTHDDITRIPITPEEFLDRYFKVAKKARMAYPEVKLVGPVPANEWQWYNWSSPIMGPGNKTIPWIEYFIQRVAQEQKTSGLRLLDVLDIHFYPYESEAEDIVQLHRVFFDKTYTYPGANGVKLVNGSWDNSQTKEYIFGRIKGWLDQYFGPGHGIGLGLTECGINHNDPSVMAVWYASTLGEFMKNGVEIFTPWHWQTGMWETLHLFARYNQEYSVQAVSTEETTVSAYPSINAAGDSLTVVLVNRSLSDKKQIHLSLSHFSAPDGPVKFLGLESLPDHETFVSHIQNALKSGRAEVKNNELTFELPPLSVTSLSLQGQSQTTATEAPDDDEEIMVFPNPFRSVLQIHVKNAGVTSIKLYDSLGRIVVAEAVDPQGTLIELSRNLPAGNYTLELYSKNRRIVKKVTSQ